MNSFGLAPYQPSSLKSSNIFVDSEQFVATEGQTRFHTSFAVNSRNLLVYHNGLLIHDNDWNLLPTVGYTTTELILNKPVSEGDTIMLVAMLERAGDKFTRRQYVFEAGSDIDNFHEIEVPFTFNEVYLSVAKEGIVQYRDVDWVALSPTRIRLHQPFVVGDRILLVEDIPVTQDDLRIDWTAIDNVPHQVENPVTETEVKDFAFEIMQEWLSEQAVNGMGSDFILHENGTTVKAKLDQIDKDIEDIGLTDTVKKSGDSGIGTLSGEEWRLMGKNRYFRLFYDSPLEHSGIKSDDEGNIVLTVNGADVATITQSGVSHSAYGGEFTTVFYPASGMLLRGIGAYALWAGQIDEGTIFTPSGWTGSWKVMSSAYRNLTNRICLLVRIL